MGKVKTRLNPYLSEEQCLGLYKAFLKDTAQIVETIECDLKILAYDSTQTMPAYLKRIFSAYLFYKQKGENLGQRMQDACEFAKSKRAGKMVVIGSDAPTLPSSYIQEAFFHLEDNDVVLGPSVDGGYYLIGVKESSARLFENIGWSSNKVFYQTLRNIQNLGKKCSVLARWYDVDDYQGLCYLQTWLQQAQDKAVAKWTRKFLTLNRELKEQIMLRSEK